MAFTEFPTQLSLDRFAQVISIHPFHFNQLRTPAAFGGAAIGCDNVIYQHQYQSPGGVPGRNDIGRAIYEAEQTLEKYLHFPLIRRYIAEEHLSKPLNRFTYLIKLQNSHLLTPAIRAAQLISVGASVTLSDEDGDGYAERVTVVANLDDATLAAYEFAEEFRVFYPGKQADPSWEIRPVAATVDATAKTVTLTFNISQLVDPQLAERMAPVPLDPDDPATFLSTVDIYRVYPDNTLASVLLLRCHPAGAPIDPIPDTQRHLFISIEDASGGIIRFNQPWGWRGWGWGGWGPYLGFSCLHPSETLSYVAGYPLSTYTKMDARFERAVVALALSRLGNICSCPGVPDYSRDLSITRTMTATQPGVFNQIHWATKPPNDVMKNPFGTSLGENIAWNTIVTEIAGETANDYLGSIGLP